MKFSTFDIACERCNAELRVTASCDHMGQPVAARIFIAHRCATDDAPPHAHPAPRAEPPAPAEPKKGRAWTPAQRKAHSVRMKQLARRKA